MAKIQKDSSKESKSPKAAKGDGQVKKALAIKNAEEDVDVKTAEAEL